ncbi:MAG: response regulator, partial [Pseudomonadales bacterium]|nr:response regulator [Pseudomonadales bacterium]
MSRRIAIVEDEAAIRENYAAVLRKQGYEVSTYPSRPKAMGAFSVRLPDLAIIDIGLEDEIDGGFLLCQELRALSLTLPIIFLTARDNDFDTVSGLRMGADDYIRKPFSQRLLIERIRALLRRKELSTEGAAPVTASESAIVRGELVLDPARHLCTWQGQPAQLTVTEFLILQSLAMRPGH